MLWGLQAALLDLPWNELPLDIKEALKETGEGSLNWRIPGIEDKRSRSNENNFSDESYLLREISTAEILEPE